MTQPDDPRQVKVIVELIDHTSRIADLNDRGDLRARLDVARERITDPQIRVVIAGQLKQGKSQLLNSLLNMPVARVGDDETTALVTIVVLRRAGVGATGRRAGARAVPSPETIEIPIDDIRHDLRRAPQAGGREVLRVEVTAPSPLLKGGLAFVDTPGVGGHGQPHLSATLGLLPDADAMLMVSDTSQEFTEPEMTVHPPGPRDLPGRRDHRDQDRPVPALARDRRGQQRAPAACRALAADDSGVVAAAQPRRAAQRQGTQRGVQLPGDRQVSLRARCCPGRTTGFAIR